MATSTIKDWANGLTGWFLRTPIFNAFRDSIAKSLDDVLSLFYSFRDAEIWKLEHNSQIVYLEHYLNNWLGIGYDPATRDARIAAGEIIWIESPNTIPPYVYNKIESRPKKYLYNKTESLPKMYLRNYSETLNTSLFVVWIPNAYNGGFSEPVMTDLINFFKLSGKSFSLQYY